MGSFVVKGDDGVSGLYKEMKPDEMPSEFQACAGHSEEFRICWETDKKCWKYHTDGKRWYKNMRNGYYIRYNLKDRDGWVDGAASYWDLCDDEGNTLYNNGETGVTVVPPKGKWNYIPHKWETDPGKDAFVTISET